MRAPRPAVVVSAIAVVLALVVVGSLVRAGFLTALDAAGAGDENVTPSTLDAVESGTVDAYYGQTIRWGECSKDQVALNRDYRPSDMSAYQCAKLYAPLDWDDPSGEKITLSLAVHRSGEDGAPVLFYNLGGPGGAAIKSLSYLIEDNLGSALVKKYDVVAVDPRGVGTSTPVKCLTDAQLDAYSSTGSVTGASEQDRAAATPEQIVADATAEVEAISKGCEKMSGDLFRHIDTVSAAKDFDMIRAVLGQKTLDYLGYSYGSFLGATYAGLFPDKVGRMVLDGAIDPAMNVDEVSALQMRGFEASIEHWIDTCLTTKTCPLKGTKAQAIAQLTEFLDGLEKNPIPTSDSKRPLTKNLAVSAIIGMLYSEKSYSMLVQALTPAMEDQDGSQLLFLADYVSDRNADGTYSSNGTEALIAVNNLDYGPVGTIEDWAKEAGLLKSELPVFGSISGYASAGLDAWPTSHAAREAITAPGAAPILVVGTTHDPATPYVMAENLAKELSSGVLVSNEGWDHTAYSKDANSCLVGAVEGYLVSGTVPEAGLTCGK